MRTTTLTTLAITAALILGACSAASDATVTETYDEQVTDVVAVDNAFPETTFSDLEIPDADLDVDFSDATHIDLSSSDSVTITNAGTYVLSGTLDSGEIIVDADDAVVTLVLDGASITAADVVAINIQDAEQVVLWLAEGSTNTIADAPSAALDETVEDAPNATIFSTEDLWIAGSGELTVTAHAADSVTSKDSLVIAGGTITVHANDDGIRGKDHLVILDGDITVNSGDDALRSDNESVSDDLDAKVGVVRINGGTLDLEAGGDAIDAANEITVAAGDIAIAADDDGMHTEGTLTINGGTIDITRSYEGIEGAFMYLNGGYVTIVATDDGINVAGGTGEETTTEQVRLEPGMNDRPAGGPAGRGGPGDDQFATVPVATNLADVTVTAMVGGGFGGPAEGASNGRFLEITGGTYIIDTNSDGVDVNGEMTMSGGLLIVSGTDDVRNGALDVDNDLIVTGGTIVANGTSNMAVAPDVGSAQASLAITFSHSLPAGTTITITDADGEFIMAATTLKVSQSLVFTSDALVAGESYTVTLGGNVSGDGTAWYIEEGTSTGGAQAGAIVAA